MVSINSPSLFASSYVFLQEWPFIINKTSSRVKEEIRDTITICSIWYVYKFLLIKCLDTFTRETKGVEPLYPSMCRHYNHCSRWLIDAFLLAVNSHEVGAVIKAEEVQTALELKAAADALAAANSPPNKTSNAYFKAAKGTYFCVCMCACVMKVSLHVCVLACNCARHINKVAASCNRYTMWINKARKP